MERLRLHGVLNLSSSCMCLRHNAAQGRCGRNASGRGSPAAAGIDVQASRGSSSREGCAFGNA